MLYVVGVGPGDPELVTIKAARCLRAADMIVAVSSGRESAVLPIVKDHVEGKTCLLIDMPMKGTLEDWQAAHQKAARLILEHIDQNIVWPMLGDPSLYASSSYVLPCLPQEKIVIVPGVTAYSAAAAAFKRPLALGRDRLTVLPGFTPGETLPSGGVVVMKAAGHVLALKRAAGGRKAYAASNVGTPMEKLSPLQDAGDDLPYLTTVLVEP